MNQNLYTCALITTRMTATTVLEKQVSITKDSK